MERIVEGVYIQEIVKGKVVQKYVPLSLVYITGKVTLGEHLDTVQAQFAALNKRLEEQDNKNDVLSRELKRLEIVFENTIRGFVTK